MWLRKKIWVVEKRNKVQFEQIVESRIVELLFTQARKLYGFRAGPHICNKYTRHNHLFVLFYLFIFCLKLTYI